MFKNEKGFSLVELAIAAGLAVALASTAVAVLSGATDTLSNNAAGAAHDSDQYNIAVLSNTDVAAKFGNNVVNALASDPDAPQNVSLTSGGNKIKVDWSAPSSNNVVLGYIVEYADNSGFNGSKTITASATTATLNGLTSGSTYYVKVSVSTDAGVFASPTVSVATPSASSAVLNVAALAAVTDNGMSSIVLSWSTPADSAGETITGYSIQYSADASFASDVVSTVSTSGAEAVLVNIKTGTYFVKVAAITSAGVGVYSTAVQVSV